MQAYDRHFFPRGPLPRRIARRCIGLVRRVSPGLADRLAPLRRTLLRRLYDGSVTHQDAAEKVLSADAARGATAHAPKPDAPVRSSAPSVDPANLRIIHVIGSLQAGGAERQVVYTLSELRRRGFSKAELLVTQGLDGALGHYRAALERASVPVSVAGATMHPDFPARLAEHPGMTDRVRGIPQALRPQTTDLVGEFLIRRPDIVHCWLDHTNLWGGVAAVLAGVPHIILSTRNVSPVHMPHLRESWFEEWYRVLAARAEVQFVNNSRAGAIDYAQWLGLPPERFRVILNGVDLSHLHTPEAAARAQWRRVLGLPAQARLLTGVFRMADEKQPFVFVRVVERVLAKFPDVHAVLAGTGRLERAVRTAMRRSPHRRRMHHVGRREDVPTLLAESYIFLLTSKAEGTPNVLLEAQHLGCPPVTTAAGGAGDAIEEGVTGFVRPIGDEPGLVESVSRLLSDGALHARMAQAGPGFVASRFGLDRMIDETIDLYRGMLRVR